MTLLHLVVVELAADAVEVVVEAVRVGRLRRRVVEHLEAAEREVGAVEVGRRAEACRPSGSADRSCRRRSSGRPGAVRDTSGWPGGGGGTIDVSAPLRSLSKSESCSGRLPHALRETAADAHERGRGHASLLLRGHGEERGRGPSGRDAVERARRVPARAACSRCARSRTRRCRTDCPAARARRGRRSARRAGRRS